MKAKPFIHSGNYKKISLNPAKIENSPKIIDLDIMLIN